MLSRDRVYDIIKLAQQAAFPAARPMTPPAPPIGSMARGNAAAMDAATQGASATRSGGLQAPSSGGMFSGALQQFNNAIKPPPPPRAFAGAGAAPVKPLSATAGINTSAVNSDPRPAFRPYQPSGQSAVGQTTPGLVPRS